jgi:hypothetical protein
MTEAEWLVCTEPRQMLEFLQGRATYRKLRLFAVACCRRIWNRMTDERSRKAVEVAERYADGEVSEEQLGAASREAAEVGIGFGLQCSSANAAGFAALRDGLFSGHVRADRCASFAARVADPAEPASQAALLRCIFGPLCFRPVTLNPSALTSTVVQLAETIYLERAFHRLPILGDALEDAGCTSADILDHCRGGGEHVRGCWVVDLVLKKG